MARYTAAAWRRREAARDRRAEKRMEQIRGGPRPRPVADDPEAELDREAEA